MTIRDVSTEMCFMKIWNYTSILEKSWQFLKRLNKNPSLDPNTLLLDVYLRKMKANVHIKTCPQAAEVALILIAQNWKQLKYSSQSDQYIIKIVLYP